MWQLITQTVNQHFSLTLTEPHLIQSDSKVELLCRPVHQTLLLLLIAAPLPLAAGMTTNNHSASLFVSGPSVRMDS